MELSILMAPLTLPLLQDLLFLQEPVEYLLKIIQISSGMILPISSVSEIVLLMENLKYQELLWEKHWQSLMRPEIRIYWWPPQEEQHVCEEQQEELVYDLRGVQYSLKQ